MALPKLRMFLEETISTKFEFITPTFTQNGFNLVVKWTDEDFERSKKFVQSLKEKFSSDDSKGTGIFVNTETFDYGRNKKTFLHTLTLSILRADDLEKVSMVIGLIPQDNACNITRLDPIVSYVWNNDKIGEIHYRQVQVFLDSLCETRCYTLDDSKDGRLLLCVDLQVIFHDPNFIKLYKDSIEKFHQVYKGLGKILIEAGNALSRISLEDLQHFRCLEFAEINGSILSFLVSKFSEVPHTDILVPKSGDSYNDKFLMLIPDDLRSCLKIEPESPTTIQTFSFQCDKTKIIPLLFNLLLRKFIAERCEGEKCFTTPETLIDIGTRFSLNKSLKKILDDPKWNSDVSSFLQLFANEKRIVLSFAELLCKISWRLFPSVPKLKVVQKGEETWFTVYEDQGPKGITFDRDLLQINYKEDKPEPTTEEEILQAVVGDGILRQVTKPRRAKPLPTKEIADENGSAVINNDNFDEDPSHAKFKSELFQAAAVADDAAAKPCIKSATQEPKCVIM